tara:strand:- start:818 stop:1057 length:240 start_codon:yes stop_codon:yes gene_type:complete
MKEKGLILSSLFIKSALILVAALSSPTMGQSLKIPVIPYDSKPSNILNKVIKRCKRAKKYGDCIHRSQRKITTSQDIDY